MRKRTRKVKVVAAMMTAAMIMTMPASTAFAAGQTYSAVTGSNVVIFEKYLTMKKDANVPPVSFNYTIEPGTAQNASVDGKTLQINAGNDANKVTGAPTIAANQATFKAGDTTYETAQDAPATLQSQHKEKNGTVIKDAVTLKDGEKYARKDVAIDFSQVQFKEPGVYRYIVTESATDGYYKDHGVTDDADSTRILDVYVVDDGVGDQSKPKMKIEGYVLHNTDADAKVLADGTSQQDTKSDGFANKFETENLTLSKTVEGNQASRDEYFEFTVKISDVLPGMKFDVTGNFDQTTQVTAINTEAKKNPSQLVVEEGKNEITQTYWLQHGQSITIKGIPKNGQYDINENATTLNNEGYTPSAEITGDTKTGANDANNVEMVSLSAASQPTLVQDTGLKADTTVAYKNAKSGTIPTGVMMVVAPFAALTLLGGAGAATIKMKRRREDEEEA